MRDKVMDKTQPASSMIPRGDGLYVKRRGKSASWIFRVQVAGKRRDISLGPEKAFTFREAKNIVHEMRRAIARGENPRNVLTRSATPRTFGQAIADFIEAAAPSWRGKSERGHTENQFKHYFKHLLNVPVAQIRRDDILPILKATASSPSVYNKLLRRTRAVFLREGALQHIERQPIEWMGLKHIIRPPHVPVRHHAAVAWRDAPTLWKSLSSRATPAAICLKLTILTATRSGESRGALWSEFDLEHGVWTIPTERTKTARPHVIPLSIGAVDLLKTRPRTKSALLFPSRSGKPLSDMGLLKEMRLLDPIATVHGWRSSFRDWGAETERDTVLLEMALGHAVGGAVERAYARSNLVELRRPIMQAWADHLAGTTALVAK